MKQKCNWYIVSPALLTFLIYLPVLLHKFVWDDTIFLQDMTVYQDPTLLIQALSQSFALSVNYFRPVGLLVFIIESQLGGLNPLFFHLINLLLHVTNTILVAILAYHLSSPGRTATERIWLPVGAALLYGLHPALVEGVSFISSQFDLLVTLFLLLGLLADICIQHRIGRALIVAFAFLLAAFSREMALAFVFVLPLWHLARRQRTIFPLSDSWRSVKQLGDLNVYLAVLIAGSLYLGIRYTLLRYLLLPDVALTLPIGNFLQHLLLIGRSLSRYLALIIWPFTNLTPIHYSPLPVPITDFAAWASLFVVLAFAVGLISLVKIVPQSGWLASAGILALLPVINILPLQLAGGSFVAERFLLFPLTLFVLALVPLSLTFQNANLGKVPGWSIPLIWLIISIGTIQLTVPHWQSDITLWTWSARRAPFSPLPPANLALAYINQGSYERALVEVDRALQLDPTQANAWNILGLALFHLEQYPEALSAFEEAVKITDDNPIFWNNLAAALREQNRLQEAEQVLLDKALPLNDDLPIVHLNLSIVYLRADRPDLAGQHLRKVIDLLPPGGENEVRDLLTQLEEPERWLRLGNILLSNNDPEGALSAFEQARILGAELADVAYGISTALIELDAFDDAETVLRQVLEQVSNDARLYNNMGIIARERKDMEAAQQYFNRAITLAPEWDVPRQYLETLGAGSP